LTQAWVGDYKRLCVETRLMKQDQRPS